MTTILTCPNRVRGDLRYRRGFARMCSPESRALPLYLDSGAYRAAAGTVPHWRSYRRYCEAIELLQPDGAMAWDVLGNQNASFRGYDRLCRDGYAERASRCGRPVRIGTARSVLWKTPVSLPGIPFFVHMLIGL